MTIKHSLVAIFTLAGAAAFSFASDAATAAPQAGDMLTDGTIYAGNGFAASPADAPGLYKWKEGKRYCEELEANGHDDWTLPTKNQLNHLYQNKNAGAFAGTFNESGSLAKWYWSAAEQVGTYAVAQRFTDGFTSLNYMDFNDMSVRCVRAAPRPGA